MPIFFQQIFAMLPIHSLPAIEPPRPKVMHGLVNQRQWADYFIARMHAKDFPLSYNLSTLADQVDALLAEPLFVKYNLLVAEANLSPANKLRGGPEHLKAQEKYLLYLEYETGLSAFIGETLCRKLNATWSGPFSAQAPLHNQYCSTVVLNNKEYNPSRYPAYRLTGAHWVPGRFWEQINGSLGYYLPQAG